MKLLGQMEGLHNLLEASGHESVGTAYDGQEATRLIQTEPPVIKIVFAVVFIMVSLKDRY